MCLLHVSVCAKQIPAYEPFAVAAKCFRSMKKNSKPHSIMVKLPSLLMQQYVIILNCMYVVLFIPKTIELFITHSVLAYMFNHGNLFVWFCPISCLKSLKELFNFVSLITCLTTICKILSTVLTSNLLLLKLLFYLFMITSVRL